MTTGEPVHDPDFNWNDDESVVVPEQAAIAVYANGAGGVTIRQEGSWPEDDRDLCIVVRPEHARALAAAILRAAAVDTEDAAEQPLTPAERARRYRARHNGRDGRHETSNGVERPAVTAVTGTP